MSTKIALIILGVIAAIIIIIMVTKSSDDPTAIDESVPVTTQNPTGTTGTQAGTTPGATDPVTPAAPTPTPTFPVTGVEPAE